MGQKVGAKPLRAQKPIGKENASHDSRGIMAFRRSPGYEIRTRQVRTSSARKKLQDRLEESGQSNCSLCARHATATAFVVALAQIDTERGKLGALFSLFVER